MVFFIVAFFGKPHADLSGVSRRNSEVAIKDLIYSSPRDELQIDCLLVWGFTFPKIVDFVQ
jgi:hypothetical protein